MRGSDKVSMNNVWLITGGKLRHVSMNYVRLITRGTLRQG